MNIILYIVSIFSIISSIVVLISNNPVLSTLALILVFFFVSFFLLLIGLDFIAFAFLIIYIGAIAVLFLFVVMMLRITTVQYKQNLKYKGGVFLFILLLCNFIFLYCLSQDFSENLSYFRFDDFNFFREITMFTVNVYAVGLFLYTEYSFIFVLCGFILLIGMVGPITLTLNDNIGIRRQQDFKQVLTNYKRNISLRINNDTKG